jgi:hypothetical protein
LLQTARRKTGGFLFADMIANLPAGRIGIVLTGMELKRSERRSSGTNLLIPIPFRLLHPFDKIPLAGNKSL